MTKQPKPKDLYVGLEAAEEIGKVLEMAAERGRSLLTTGFDAWTHEGQRFFEDLSAQAAATMSQLAACRTPLEVLEVEQAWLTARARAYLESGQRLIKAAQQTQPAAPS